jgi:hypothetical protein
MTNPIVLNRIRNQIDRNIPTAVQVAYEAIAQVTLSPPISLDELREILMQELEVAPIKQEEPIQSQTVHFENIYEFTNWYAENQLKFSSQQRTALDTLMQTRGMMESGCACKRNSREHIGNSYFIEFWTNNCKTDILPTIAKITGASTITIASCCSFSVNG